MTSSCSLLSNEFSFSQVGNVEAWALSSRYFPIVPLQNRRFLFNDWRVGFVLVVLFCFPIPTSNSKLVLALFLDCTC